jgi:hypothetical protein
MMSSLDGAVGFELETAAKQPITSGSLGRDAETRREFLSLSTRQSD